MVYDWSSKEAICRRMVTEDMKTQDEMLDILKTQGFSPSKRAFQNQLKIWNFDKKHTPAAKRPEVVAAVEQLWKQHVTPKEMLRILNEERGFEVGARELVRLRAENQWFIRARNTMGEEEVARPKVGGGGVEDEEVGGTASEREDEELIAAIDEELASLSPAPALSTNLPGPQLLGLNTQHLLRASAHSISTDLTSPIPERQKAAADKMARAEERKARRRMHHPDTGKFPSEMKLEDCKSVLGIDEATYQAIRAAFLSICETSGIQRKKGCDIWPNAKGRLIDSVPALKAIFEQQMTATDKDRKELALDLICQDRTKNVRRNATRMELRTAKKVLGLDPAGVMRVRAALMAKLKADGFSTKTEAGDEHWKGLRDAWIKEQGLDGKGEQGQKACNVICADVMKRINDKRTLNRKKEKKAAEPQDGQKPGDEDGEVGDEEMQDDRSEGADEEMAVTRPRSMLPGTTAGYEYGAFPAPYTPYSMGPYATSETPYTPYRTTTAPHPYPPTTASHTSTTAAVPPTYTTTQAPPSTSEYPEIDPALFYGS